jgi:16S rRNA (uracil1498-N3)-methyltransferase
MRSYFVPHKLKVGDITHLSDKDSEYIITQKLFAEEDPIEVFTLDAVFLGIVSEIGKSSVEVEIVKKVSDTKNSEEGFSITIIQSISNDIRFNYFLEKAVEIGVNHIIPIESEYSQVSKEKALKKYNLWEKVIREAKEQSRNSTNITIAKPIKVSEISKIDSKYKICLATESNKALKLKDSLASKKDNSSYTIAIGAERGWSISDIKTFEKLGFEFIKLNGNILRTETAGLVISAILNFKEGKL